MRYLVYGVYKGCRHRYSIGVYLVYFDWYLVYLLQCERYLVYPCYPVHLCSLAPYHKLSTVQLHSELKYSNNKLH